MTRGIVEKHKKKKGEAGTRRYTTSEQEKKREKIAVSFRERKSGGWLIYNSDEGKVLLMKKR